MKKPITIGVIAVIATILVTSAVDFSAVGTQPQQQIRLQVADSGYGGVISCPNKDTVDTSLVGFIFTEHDGSDPRGTFNQNANQMSFSGDLWSGKIQADRFAFTGVGFANSDLAQFCGENASERFEMRIWGKCGTDVTVQFDSDIGYSGSFTGNLLCV